MSRLLSRVLLAILMFPLASVAYLVVYFARLEIGRNSQYGDALYYGMSGAATWGLVAMYWFSLWRGSVGWTERRRRATLLGAVMTTSPRSSAASQRRCCG